MNQSLDGNCSRLVESPSYSFLVLSFFVVFGGIGNSLVCLSIILEKRLQNVTNYFLFSLALADLMVSLLVMPFAMLNEYFNGIWVFGYVTCTLYSSLDVLLCSVSIVHMAVISLDRYRGISQPFKNRNKTVQQVAFKILITWLFASIICSPLTILALINPKNIYGNCLCGIFPNFQLPHFQIYGSVLTFLIPAVIMTVTYLKTVLLLREQMALCTGKNDAGLVLRRNTNTPKPPTYNGNMADEPSLEREEETAVSGLMTMQAIHVKLLESMDVRSQKKRSTGRRWSRRPSLFKEKRSLKADLRRAATLSYFAKRDSVHAVARETKATKVLGVVFFSFFFCWTPFFLANMVLAICGRVCAVHFPPSVSTIFLWLGYVSSTINPLIYTTFNKTFRASFRAILLCLFCRGQPTRRTSSLSRVSKIPVVTVPRTVRRSTRSRSNHSHVFSFVHRPCNAVTFDVHEANV